MSKEIRLKRIPGEAVPFKNFILPKDIKEPLIASKKGNVKAFSTKKDNALINCESWFELNGIDQNNPSSLKTVLTELNLYNVINNELKRCGRKAPKFPAGYVKYFSEKADESYYSILQFFGNNKFNMSEALDIARKTRDKSFFVLVKLAGEWEKFYKLACDKQGIKTTKSKNPNILTIYKDKNGFGAFPLNIEPKEGVVEISNILGTINLPYMASRLKCSNNIVNEIDYAILNIEKGNSVPGVIPPTLIRRFNY